MNEEQKIMPAENRWNHIPKRYKNVELSNQDLLALDKAITRIKDQRSRVEELCGINKVKGYPTGMMLAFNQHLANTPIFWCFNNWAEPVLFMNGNPDQKQFYALHSYHKVLNTWRDKTKYHEHFAHLYFNEIRSYCQNEPILIGNCQGAPIMESTAILFSKKLDLKPLLVTIDYYPRRQYEGPMVLLFGRESNFNPFYNSDLDPIPAWRSKFNDFGWGIINTTHGGYFLEPGLSHLRRLINKSIDIYNSGSGFSQCEVLVDDYT